MDALVRYRSVLGRPPLPSPEEAHVSAIARLRTNPDWERKPVSPEVLYRDVSKTGARAAEYLREGAILPEMEALDRETLATTLETLSPHWFRHSGASIAINTGAMSLESASKMLGHADPAMTAAMYYHRSDAHLSEGVQKLGEKFFR
jgi:integrase